MGSPLVGCLLGSKPWSDSREQPGQSRAEIVSIECLHFNDPPGNQIDIDHAFVCRFQRDSFVIGPPGPERLRNRVERGAEIITAAAAIHDAKIGDLPRQVMTALPFQ
jgi:hypothetical protein